MLLYFFYCQYSFAQLTIFIVRLKEFKLGGLLIQVSNHFFFHVQGVILSRLEGKLLEIRSYHINWESYYQGNMISQADFQFISHYDKQNQDGKKQLFEKDPEQVGLVCILCIILFMFVFSFISMTFKTIFNLGFTEVIIIGYHWPKF